VSERVDQCAICGYQGTRQDVNFHLKHGQCLRFTLDRLAEIKAERDRYQAVLTAIASPCKRYLRTGDWVAYVWNMQHAAQAALDGVPNDKNDPLAALEGR
jgi:hypothetical protein